MKQNRNGVMVFFNDFKASPEFISGANSWTVDHGVLNVYGVSPTSVNQHVASFTNWAGIKLVESSTQFTYTTGVEDEHQKS